MTKSLRSAAIENIVTMLAATGRGPAGRQGAAPGDPPWLYSLAPEDPAPAARDDAARAYRCVVENQERRRGS